MSEPTVRIVCAQGAPALTLPLAETLRLAGFSVREASTAAQLLRLAAETPDVIVLEDSLPDCPAASVLRQLKDEPGTSAIPVLLLAAPSEPVELGGREAEGYLAGRPEPAEVLSWVRACWRRQESMRLESLGRMAAGIAHDFNNLLTVILGHAHLLEECLPAASPDMELLGIVERSAKTASQLASQMLTLARHQRMELSSVDLNAMTHDLLGLLRRAFPSGVEFDVQADPQLTAVWAVPAQMVQVLLNLCLNARDAMSQGGRLTVATEVMTRENSRFVRLRVADTGAGIPADALPRIFEPFFTGRPGRGSGIGLSTVQRIVRQHRGWIECRSEVGHGSCFDVYLPAC